MSQTLERTATLVTITCPACGIMFAVPEHWYQKRRERRTRFYCPNGDCLSYRESEADKLKKKLAAKDAEIGWYSDALKRSRQQTTHAEARRRAEKAAKTRIKNRIAAGVCPCCNRTFQNLARHMQNQHPEFTKNEAGEGDEHGKQV